MVKKSGDFDEEQYKLDYPIIIREINNSNRGHGLYRTNKYEDDGLGIKFIAYFKNGGQRKVWLSKQTILEISEPDVLDLG